MSVAPLVVPVFILHSELTRTRLCEYVNRNLRDWDSATCICSVLYMVTRSACYLGWLQQCIHLSCLSMLQVKAQEYPHILVTAGLNGTVLAFRVSVGYGYSCYTICSQLTPLWQLDPRVMYSEPAKFVAKLRELKTDDNLLLFKCELGAGHFSKSGR